MTTRVPIRSLSSGVVGLDEVLGGGIPELSFNLIIGGPGCGKTTLGHHIAFANASSDRKVLYFTVIGEPPIKMLRYQQQYSFFDTKKVGDSIHFVNLASEASRGGLAAVLERIIEEVQRVSPALVIVDSFRSVMRHLASSSTELGVEDFIQRLALELTSCEATTFLLGEYAHVARRQPRLHRRRRHHRALPIRRAQLGRAQAPGREDARTGPNPRASDDAHRRRRLERLSAAAQPASSAAAEGAYEGRLDDRRRRARRDARRRHTARLLGARRGPVGLRQDGADEPVHLARATSMASPASSRSSRNVRTTTCRRRPFAPSSIAWWPKASSRSSICARSISRSTRRCSPCRKPSQRIGAKRAVIDSLSGLELALAPTFRDDFRESLYRMVGALTGLGVTVMSTVELSDSFIDLQFSPQSIAFLTDAIIMQRYVEIDGELRRAMGVVKVRGSQHSKEMREYTIGPRRPSGRRRRAQGLRRAAQRRRRGGRRDGPKRSRRSSDETRSAR